jgi:hypothetical protein
LAVHQGGLELQRMWKAAWKKQSLPTAPRPSLAAAATPIKPVDPAASPKPTFQSTPLSTPVVPAIQPTPSSTPSIKLVIKPPKKESTIIGKMPVEQQKSLLQLHKRLVANNASMWFRTPVDPVALNIPTYLDTIKKPMDLSTIAKKLKTGKYDRPEDYRADVELTVVNCETFNGTAVYMGC